MIAKAELKKRKQTGLCEAELASTPLSMGGGELVRVWRKADARSLLVGGVLA